MSSLSVLYVTATMALTLSISQLAHGHSEASDSCQAGKLVSDEPRALEIYEDAVEMSREPATISALPGHLRIWHIERELSTPDEGVPIAFHRSAQDAVLISDPPGLLATRHDLAPGNRPH